MKAIRLAVCSLVALVSLASASGLKPGTPAATPVDWAEYWKSVGVDPAPPKGFLKVDYSGRIENLTDGKLPDATVRQWVLADLRRGQGDFYAGKNLRDDIANAGVFGPKGLNGTGQNIQMMRQAGVVRTEGPGPDILAVAVIAVPPQLQRAHPEAALTDYVVVMLFRAPQGSGTIYFQDGRTETRQGYGKGHGEENLFWQLDTGYFYQHPVLGPLWYQKSGWSCQPGDSGIGTLCARVKPANGNRPPS